MNATTKIKLCWNCEGRVTLEQENCPYCGVYLSPSSGSEKDNSILPPYRLVTTEEEAAIPKSPYSTASDAVENESTQASLEESNEADQINAIIIPMGLLLIGVSFLLFSLILLLFSDRGVLTLSWNADIWYVYLALAVPSLFFGWRALR